MGCSWIGLSALGVLSLYFPGRTARPQKNAGATERSSIDARAEKPQQERALATISGRAQPRTVAHSGHDKSPAEFSTVGL
jgi:hypothetical protein